jgi:hypothetical protein
MGVGFLQLPCRVHNVDCFSNDYFFMKCFLNDLFFLIIYSDYLKWL